MYREDLRLMFFNTEIILREEEKWGADGKRTRIQTISSLPSSFCLFPS
jgi:hypothetical protein